MHVNVTKMLEVLVNKFNSFIVGYLIQELLSFGHQVKAINDFRRCSQN